MSNPIKFSPGAAGGVATISAGPVAAQGPSLKQISQIMMAAAGALLLVAGLVFFIFNTKIQKAQSVEAAKEAEVGSGQEVAKKFDATLADYNSMRDQLKHLEISGATSAYVPTLLPQVQKLAESYHCQVSKIEPGAIGTGAAGPTQVGSSPAASSATASPDAAVPYQIMPVSLSLVGSYSEIMHFVYSLTQFPKIVSLKTITLHPGNAGVLAPGANSPNHSLNADIDLQAYVFPADPVVAPASTPTAKPVSPVSQSEIVSGKSSVGKAINTPISGRLHIQTQNRSVNAALQAQPASKTMSTNTSLGRS